MCVVPSGKPLGRCQSVELFRDVNSQKRALFCVQGGEDEALERLAKYMARGDWVRPASVNFISPVFLPAP